MRGTHYVNYRIDLSHPFIVFVSVVDVTEAETVSFSSGYQIIQI